jgi:hypothetical protein
VTRRHRHRVVPLLILVVQGLIAGTAAGSPLALFLADPGFFTADAPFPVAEAPLELTGAKVYPNPFDPFEDDALIAFTISEPAEVTVTAYDWNGDFVDTVFRGSLAAGANTVDWGGQTEDGRKLGNGVYFLRIVAAVSARQESTVLKVAVWND